MGMGTYIKQAAAWAGKNQRVSSFFASDIGRSYAKWMTVGAAGGAIRGLADNIVGEDRVSVLGGAIQGAMWGAAGRGMKQMWGLRKAKAISAGVVGGDMSGWQAKRSVIYGQAPRAPAGLLTSRSMVTPPPSAMLSLPAPRGR